MRKTAFSALFACLLLLSGCGGEGEKAFNPADTAAAVLDAGAFSETLEPLERDLIPLLYGIPEQSVQDWAVYASTGATAEELAVLTLVDEQGAKDAEQRLRARVSDQKAALAAYQPGELVKLEAAIVQRRGNSVFFAVAADADQALAALETLE